MADFQVETFISFLSPFPPLPLCLTFHPFERLVSCFLPRFGSNRFEKSGIDDIFLSFFFSPFESRFVSRPILSNYRLPVTRVDATGDFRREKTLETRAHSFPGRGRLWIYPADLPFVAFYFPPVGNPMPSFARLMACPTSPTLCRLSNEMKNDRAQFVVSR